MKSKAIIGTIIAVGIVVIGAVYFMSSTPAQATTSTNTGLNVNALNSTSNATGATNSQNNVNTNNQNKDIHTQNTSSQAKNTNESNNNQNTQNNNNNNQAQAKPTPTPAPKPVVKKATINTGTGNFADIISGANYMTGTIDGTQIIIPLQGGHVVNNMLVLPEYYTSKLNETFTAKIASLGDNNFVLYEYYGDTNTATFKLKYHNTQYGAPTLAGTFTHTGSNEVTGITFNLVSSNYSGMLAKMPFYHTNINGTDVTVISKFNNSGYYEKYAGDNNLFTLSYDYKNNNRKYQFILNESYNGKISGEYLLNPIGNTGNAKGIFITKPGTSESQTFDVTLTGSLNP